MRRPLDKDTRTSWWVYGIGTALLGLVSLWAASFLPGAAQASPVDPIPEVISEYVLAQVGRQGGCSATAPCSASSFTTTGAANVGSLVSTGAISGTTGAFSGTVTSSVGAGSNAVAFSTNTARLDLGLGANDYFFSNGSYLESASSLLVGGTALAATFASTGSLLSLRGTAAASGVAAKISNSNALTTGKILQLFKDDSVTVVRQWGPNGKAFIDSTDSSGTPGAATINKPMGKSAVASGAASVVITNSEVTTTSVAHITPMSTTANCVGAYVTIASGSFTVTCPGGNAGADFFFAWEVQELD